MQLPHPVTTQFFSVQDVATAIHQLGLPTVFQRLADTIRADYQRWNDFEKCARVANHSKDGVIELMPISDGKTYSFKFVNGHPKNTQIGLPCVMAFGVLADVATGIPEFLSELTLSTALRTAAMSLVAAKALARPGSKVMALIGNGAQSEFQALAFHYLMGIEELRLFDTDPRATDKLLANLAHTPLRLTVCKSVREAVRGADIVTTVTADKTNATVLSPDMLERGMHINGVGGDCPGKTELHPDVLRASAVFVEYEPQTRIEGDLQHLPADFAVTELWQVLTGQAKGRVDAQQITLFDSVGFALQDYSVLRLMRELAKELGLGQPVSLIPELVNPKDLFMLLQPELQPVAEATGRGKAKMAA
ncbi:MAG: ornithine cyclodeaminase [Comamonadaceae bacterium CG1_02_60_18]|nr:MAG: ornithine cyclodeaminase [Comamonadaceae bacterium CG1_02_60_18]PIQ50512.1 MAG: ornithine cyclodeaminase [Comamonadaceae bacterium CG12_big_fil_rev_8_21_14_0_65_59_15]